VQTVSYASAATSSVQTMVMDFLPALLNARRPDRAVMIARHLLATTTARVTCGSFGSPDGINVVASFPGKGPPLVISAHYDGAGAYDNASGVVALLGLSCHLSRESVPCAVKCVFFDREESDQAGSRSYLKTQRDRGRLPFAHIAIDGVGVGEKMVGVWNSSHLELLLEQRRHSVECSCDSQTFLQHGIPTVHAFSLPGHEAASFVQYRHAPASWHVLHTPADTHDRICPLAMRSNTTDLLRSACHLLRHRSMHSRAHVGFLGSLGCGSG